MILYGLTGGIGSGKSAVARMFRDRGVVVLDADRIGRDLLQVGSDYAHQVADRFPACSRGAGRIDRGELARLVFSDAAARKWLEELLHPAIWQAFLERARRAFAGGESAYPFCLLEGAVLLESKTPFPLAGIIVVFAPLEIRKERLRRRGDLAPDQVEARMKAQLPEDVKLQKATHLVDNSGSPEQTRRQVDTVLNQLRREHGGPE